MRIVTWNVQRKSISDGDNESKARRKFLKHLVENYDVVFLQETPQELNKNDVTDFEGRRVYKQSHEDGQDERVACRCTIITNLAAHPVEDCNTLSGGEGFRLPATIVDTQSGIVFSSFHATSNGIPTNTVEYTKQKDQIFADSAGYLAEPKPSRLWVVGADFNFEINKGHVVGISYPPEATQNKGGTLDGFYFASDGPVALPKSKLYDDKTGGFEPSFRTDRDEGGRDEGGFFVRTPYPQSGGERSSSRKRSAPEPEYKLSDHAPVVTEFALPPPSSASSASTSSPSTSSSSAS